ncbi:hypothetical protein ACOMHN_053835 [Nucella lapillus]
MAQCSLSVFLCLLLLTTALSLDLAHIKRIKRQVDDVNDDMLDDISRPGRRDDIDNNNNNNNDNDRDDANDNDNNNSKAPAKPPPGEATLSLAQFKEKIKELVERNREASEPADDGPWERDGESAGLRAFFDNLDDLADQAPDDMDDFDPATVFGQVQSAGPRQVALNNRCLKNPARLQSFLAEYRDAVKDVRKEIAENNREAIKEAMEAVLDRDIER